MLIEREVNHDNAQTCAPIEAIATFMAIKHASRQR